MDKTEEALELWCYVPDINFESSEAEESYKKGQKEYGVYRWKNLNRESKYFNRKQMAPDSQSLNFLKSPSLDCLTLLQKDVQPLPVFYAILPWL